MKRLDIYIVIAVIVISIGLFLTFSLQSQENREVVISLKGEEYSRVKLDGKEHLFEIKTELGYNKLLLMQTEFELKKLIVQTMIV